MSSNKINIFIQEDTSNYVSLVDNNKIYEFVPEKNGHIGLYSPSENIGNISVNIYHGIIGECVALLNKEETTDYTGIIPVMKNTFGKYNIPDGYIVTQGICTNSGIISEYSLLKSIHFYANKNGKIRFGVGSIDQRGWAIIQDYFDVDCNEGENNINALNKSIKFPDNGKLFAYNNFYGDGCSLGYKKTNDSLYYHYVFSNDTKSALTPLGNDILSDGESAYLCLEYTTASDELLYELRYSAKINDSWTESSLFKAANLLAQRNIIIGDDGKTYRLSVNSGNISVSELKYNKITIFGNSIWNYGASGTWLPPVSDDSGEWVYDNGSDGGMSGMEGRGMAASIQDNDFKHLFLKALKGNNPEVIVQGVNIPNVERDLPYEFPTIYDYLLTEDVDIIFWRAGENVSDITDNYRRTLRNYVRYFKKKCPKAIIILTGRFWRQEKCDSYTNEVADEFNIPFIRMCMDDERYHAKSDDIVSYKVKLEGHENTKEVFAKAGMAAGHPNDLGMYIIANRMLSSIGVPQLDMIRNVNIINGNNYSYTANDQWVIGGVYTIIFNGNIPTISVTNDSESEIIEIYNIENSYYFIMPDSDVTITLS